MVAAGRHHYVALPSSRGGPFGPPGPVTAAEIWAVLRVEIFGLLPKEVC
eukprot:COSAG02_NODE_40894_length_400_cov_0.867110_1_plen_48_part_10